MTTTQSSLSKKLQIKPNSRVLVLGAPDGRAELLEPLPQGASLSTLARGSFDVVLFFVEKAKELEKGGLKAISAVRDGGVLWIAYPKKSSGVETDLTRDVGWKVIEEAGWGGVAQVAIDETWSALRFKPEAMVARKENSAAAPGARKTGAARKESANGTAPSDLSVALATSAAASATWGSLAPSHRREYVGWIEEAKKPETRARRIASAVEMMAAGVRDRNAKYAR
ncbi:YdeI/OmpD-associated family protein [Polyangium sp. y55x31]|uniref:YdeI/OmpD-associated family protein n=1 Tax=Polyangium sp. y55x31 TaxID=3042688 RepID=UPI00248304D6|nr:YdeI/OmpD-associated family protein [Polyangium sp. y55x31]MDI1481204.1 YdeI/OmpD-associated family protein [Polyangium sp. y55x31]